MTKRPNCFGIEEKYYPLDERIILDSGIAVFESQVDGLNDSSLDFRFLSTLPKMDVWYGAKTAEIYPFICFPPVSLTELPTGKEVLNLLKASCFESEHIKDLNIVNIPFPGYKPYTKNDEVHSDANQQHFFSRERKEEDELEDIVELDLWEEDEESRENHKLLQRFVSDERLYYVLIHTKPRKYEDFEASEYVIIFAVGVSPESGNLVGVASHQVCHNLCD